MMDLAVVYCADQRFYPGLAASLASLISFHPDVPVIVISWDLDPQQESILARYASVVGRETGLPDDPCWGRLGALRLPLRRAVYLDADTIVTAPIDALWRTNAPVAVAPNLNWPISTNFRGLSTLQELGIPPTLLCFNTGVLSLRLNELQTDLYDDLLALNARFGDDFLLGDQSAFHLALYGGDVAWEWLPETYNGMAEFWDWSTGAPHVIHFAGPDKPWGRQYPEPGRTHYLRWAGALA